MLIDRMLDERDRRNEHEAMMKALAEKLPTESSEEDD